MSTLLVPVIAQEESALNAVRYEERWLGLPPDLSIDDWRAVGGDLFRIDRGHPWWLGDWWRYGVRRYGESAALAALTGFALQTVKNAAWVAERFELSRRRDDVAFSHHAEVAALPSDQADVLLERAATTRWSQKDLRREVRRIRIEQQRVVVASEDAIISLSSWEDWLPQQPQCDVLTTDPSYMTDVADIEAFATHWLPQAPTKVKPTGRAYVCVGPYPVELRAYLAVDPPSWLVFDQVLVWTYRNTLGPSPTYGYKNNWQAILYYRGVEAPPLDCPELVEQFSVQDINAPGDAQEPRWHPWQKPDLLGERFVRHATSPGDLVLDPFAGTGSFLLAAARLGRKAIGCDRDPTMVDLAVKRGCVRAAGGAA